MLKHIKNTEEWNDKGLAAKGFTLIELLVVIVILGILAAVVVFAVSGITDKGTVSACKTEKRTLITAAEAYFAQNGSYPADPSVLSSAGFLDKSGTPSYWNFSGGSGTTPPTYTTTVTPGKNDSGAKCTY